MSISGYMQPNQECSKEGLIKSRKMLSADKAVLLASHLRHG